MEKRWRTRLAAGPRNTDCGRIHEFEIELGEQVTSPLDGVLRRRP
jgi:hypothetical protein